MRSILQIIRRGVLTSLVMANFAASIQAQEVSIPDPDLNAAIRDALQKQAGPLTEQDLLSLTNLNACCRNVKSLEGLGAARNLLALDLENNQLTSLALPTSLTNLIVLALEHNQLTSLILPPGMLRLSSLFLGDNPLNALVLPEPAATNLLAGLVATMQGEGVNVFIYPLTVQLIRPRQPIGAFQFAINGPPGAYTVLVSTNLTDWSELVVSTNSVGKVTLTDGTAHLSPQKFYRTSFSP